jgi:hypothetical protein
LARQTSYLRSFYILIAWMLIVTVLLGPGLAHAEGRETNFGLYLSGSRDAAGLMAALRFSDLPTGSEGASIVRLAAQGVLRGDGSGRFNPEAAVTREQALVSLVRLLGWEDQAIEAATVRTGGAATTGASPWAAGFISVAITQGLIGNDGNRTSAGTTGNTIPWDAPATRQEVAAWCVRALAPSSGISGTNTSVALAAYSDADEVRPEFKAFLHQAIELGLLTPVALGRLAPHGAVTRAELALILDRLVCLLPPTFGTAWEVGTLENWVLENEEVAGLPAKSALWTLVRPGGSKTALKLSSDYRGVPLSQAVVYTGGQLTYGEALKPGDTVRYLVQGDRVVPFIEILPVGMATINGLIEQIETETRQLTIRDANRVVHHLMLSPMLGINVAGSPASVHDLVAGQDVTVTALDGIVLEIAAGSTGIDHAADPPPLEVSGRVRTVDSRNLLLILTDGRVVKYDLSSGTQVVAQGQLSTPSAIQPGDQVQVHLYSPTSTWAQRIVVAGSAARVSELVRGRLGSFTPRSGRIVLTDAQRLSSGVWESAAQTMELPLRADADIWYENQQLDLVSAARLTGAEVYAVISGGFGRPEVVAAMIWQGQEKSYEGAIDEINPGLGLVKLPGAELLLSPGAIVLKDGRLADPYGLEKGDSIRALASRSGGNSLGLVVSVLGKEQGYFPGLTVYRGRVDNMGRTAFTLNSYQTFSDGTWSSRRRRTSDDLGLGRDTKVLSLLGDEPAELTLDQLRQGLWQDLYRDAEVLAAVEDGDTLGLALWPTGELEAARLSRAQIVAVTATGSSAETGSSSQMSISLRNVADFSPAKGTWQHAGTEVELRAEQALVVKNGCAYTGDELAPDDDIVFLRRGQSVLLAWVKE